jgi:hypothetical protein
MLKINKGWYKLYIDHKLILYSKKLYCVLKAAEYYENLQNFANIFLRILTLILNVDVF